MRTPRLTPLLAPLLVPALLGAQTPPRAQPRFSAAALARWERTARAVTIYRDTYGVPHVYAPTDAGVVFGVMYAQAEDNFWQLEEDYVRLLGRTAELYGDSTLGIDVASRLFEVERKSRAAYRRATPRLRALCDAFAAGLNFYLARHPDAPRLITRFEPWQALATDFGAGAVDTLAALDTLAAWAERDSTAGNREPGIGDRRGPFSVPDSRFPMPDDVGSNMWALAPARSASGHAMLFINPHVGFFGGGQRWEVHLQSGEGWRFSGFAILGTPIPRTGHNGVLGWSHTNNYADASDVYVETFDDPAHPLAYRYGAGHRTAARWTDSVRVRTDAGVVVRRLTFRKTHHGPVVATDGRHALTVRRARMDEGGALEQRYRMARARTFAEWRAAMARGRIVGSNTMYADRAGNIFYVHGNAIPRRAPNVDPSRALDGSDPATDWRGYYTIDELPHALNPRSGWLANTNSTPFHVTSAGNPDSAAFPAYAAPEPFNARLQSSHRLLADARSLTLDGLERLGFDRHVQVADSMLPRLFDRFEQLRAAAVPQAGAPGLADSVAPLVAELRAWDRASDTGSVAMTLFFEWARRVGRPADSDTATAGQGSAPAQDPWRSLRLLAAVRRDLERTFGSWRVPWGEVNRLQRVQPTRSSRVPGGLEPFSDARPSWPVRGGPPSMGIIFAFNARPERGQKRLYGVSGGTYIAVVEFAPRVRARSLLVFGQSADPASPHFLDQAEMYATGRMKPAWFSLADVKAHAERVYHPGDDSAGRDAPTR